VIKKFYSFFPSSGWKAAVTGVILIILFLATLTGVFFNSGLPVFINAFIGLLAGVITLLIAGAFLFLIRKLFIKIPTAVVIVFLAATITLAGLQTFFRLPNPVFYGGGILFILLTALLCNYLRLLITSGVSSLSKHQKIISSIVIITWCLAFGGSMYWLMKKGNYDLKVEELTDHVLPNPLDLENPAAKGNYSVKHIFYGSGKNKRRPEYGKEANLITPTVDASLLLPEWKDFKKKMREWYWGFGVKEFPLNGSVWYPEGDGPFPLVLIVHGNHGMEEYSDPGYAYLGELLASRGFITVSVDENFINATWSGDFVGKEMQTRGWLLLQHLNVWSKWNGAKDNLFFNKVDMKQIALIGHSRGGEAIAIAAAFNQLDFYPDNASVKFDFHFDIRSLIALAPTDRRYTRRLKLNNINYLTLQGGYDSDEPSFFGMRQAERITYNGDQYYFKSGLYMPGANHGQFNSVWKQDANPPYSWMLNEKPLITETDQQEAAKVYISAFLETTLRNKKEYVPLFENWAYGKNWLPKGQYLNRFEDNKFIEVAGYEEDIDLTTGSTNQTTIDGQQLKVWREAELFYRDGKDKQANSAVIIGWKNDKEQKEKSSYSIYLPVSFAASHSLEENDAFTFAFSEGHPKELKDEKKEGEEKPKEKKAEEPKIKTDFIIVLEDSLGTTASLNAREVIQLLPRWEIRYLKLKDQNTTQFGDLWEPTLTNYQLPLDLFVQKSPQLKVLALKRIEFRFDRSPSGVIILDKIGFQKKVSNRY
jgi:dienelactone hydrolase